METSTRIIDYHERAYRRAKLKNHSFRKKVSMEPPQYNGGLWGLQKREYLARTISRFIEEFIEDMVFRP
jgi:hypothetical protein